MQRVCGAGGLAPHVIAAHRTVRPGLSRVLIWNRSPARAKALAESISVDAEIAAIDELDAALLEDLPPGPLGLLIAPEPVDEADPLLGEAVRDMARIGGEVVDLMDTNTLRKRLHKVRFISITEPLLVGFGIPNYAPASLFIILETPFLVNVAAK